jgi:cytochrome c-L
MLRAAGFGLSLLLAAATSIPPALAQADAPLLEDSAGECPEPLTFTHVLTGDPLPQYKPDEEITPAVAEFHCSGENPYSGNDEAVADGQGLFRLCASCHGLRGEGRIGPRLTDETVKYERVANAHGEFEVVYGGAAGAMQPMGRRFTQDEILRIMAYVETLESQ